METGISLKERRAQMEMTERPPVVRFALMAVLLITGALMLSACGQQGGGEGGEEQKVAFLLPEDVTPRWEGKDRPYFEEAMQEYAPDAEVIVNNAQAESSRQQDQGEAAITNGADVLVVAPVDLEAAATIVQEAEQADVPVVAYDRLILDSPVDYYVSFDPIEVGKLQGEYIAENTEEGGNVVVINGSQTDDNAQLFHEGYMSVLEPLFENGTLEKGYESWTPDWNPADAQRQMEQALTQLDNEVDGVLSANDSMATTIIAALSQQGLAGEVIVTGQDATVSGLKNILQGEQSMTVYKPLREQADAAAEISATLLEGGEPDSDAITDQIDNQFREIPSVLLDPETVTKDNVDTVVEDGFVEREELCEDNEDLCEEAGI